MGARAGWKGKSYRNTGTYAVPVWNLCDNIKDQTIDLNKAMGDVSRRAAGGWKQEIGVQKEGVITFGSVWDTSHDDYGTFRDSWLDDTAIDMLFLDKEVTVAGAQGLRAEVEVVKFPRSEQLTEAMGQDIELRPTWSENAPAWWTTA